MKVRMGKNGKNGTSSRHWINHDGTIDYQSYLLGDQWKEKRRLAITSALWSCEVCGKYDRLQVHHLHYFTLGQEKMKDFLVVCKPCHKIADKVRRHAIQLFNAAHTFERKGGGNIDDAFAWIDRKVKSGNWGWIDHDFVDWLRKTKKAKDVLILARSKLLYCNDYGEECGNLDWIY